MSANDVVSADMRALAADIADRFAGVMSVQLVELAALLQPAQNVRAVPGQRASYGTMTLVAGQTFQITGKREDLKTLRISYAGAAEAAAAKPDVIRVSNNLSNIQAATPFGCYCLNAQMRTLDLEVNEDDVYVGLGTDAASAAGPLTISWRIEEYDPNLVAGVHHR